MDTKKQKLVSMLLAVVIAVGLFWLGGMVATKAKESTLLAQSRVLRGLLQEDSVDALSILKDKDTRILLQKFVAAVASGYVNFELIPYNEGKTLSLLLSSINKGITIDSFSYSGRDFIIKGSCDDFESLDKFVTNLREADYFKQVSVDTNWSLEKTEFTIHCYANAPDTPQDYFQNEILRQNSL